MTSEMRTCSHCKAYYRKSHDWHVGYYKGTSSVFDAVMKLSENQCPVCRKEHIE